MLHARPRLLVPLSLVSILAAACAAHEPDRAGEPARSEGAQTEGLQSEGISATLAFSSGRADYDAAYAKATQVIGADVKEGKFIAGESWDQVWTRDTSYSIDLGAGLLYPEVAKATLLGMTQETSPHR